MEARTFVNDTAEQGLTCRTGFHVDSIGHSENARSLIEKPRSILLRFKLYRTSVNFTVY